jgi:hypothetical protein
MRKIIFVLTVIGILAMYSCSKTTPITPGLAGDWSYGPNAYQAVSCTANTSQATLTAVNTTTGSNYANLVISFYDTLPTVNGTYRVIYAGTAPGPKQVSISMAYIATDTSIYYGSTGGTASYPKDTVNVTVAKGKITVVGSNVEMSTNTGPFDTIPLNFTITQTQ